MLVEKPGQTRFTLLEVLSRHHMPKSDMTRGALPFLVLSAQMQNISPVKKTSGQNLNRRIFCQTPAKSLLKTVKVMRNKESLRNSHRAEETSEP